jgi:hypothetical protein
MFQQIKFLIFSKTFTKTGNPYSKNFNNTTNATKSSKNNGIIRNTNELDSMPSFGKIYSLYYPNTFSINRSLGNRPKESMPEIVSKLIAIFGG